MLVGEPPFAGTGARATMARHADRDARVPIRVRRPTVPVAIERAVARALAKVPDRALPGHGGVLRRPGRPDRPRSSGAAGWPGRGVASDRGAAVRQRERRSRERVLQRRDDRRADHGARQGGGPERGSRTSVFALKGVRDDVRAIGARLNVSAVLEGSVRKAGNRLRIAVQLTSVARRPDALVRAVRSRAGRRLRHPGRDRADHRAHAPRSTLLRDLAIRCR